MKKIILDIKKVEKALNVDLKRSVISLGLDTATKTGYCIAKTNYKTISIDVGFINLDVKGIKDRTLRNELRYEEIFERFKNLIQKEFIVVIEDVYYSGNAQTLILLARIGAIAWTLAKVKKCKLIIWKSATSARALLGLPCKKKKPIVMKAINKALGTDFTNADEVDALVLALGGLVK